MTQSLEFLTALFGSVPAGLIEIRSWPESDKQKITCQFFKTVAEAEAVVTQAIAANRHVFVGAASRSKRSGKRDAVAAMQWLWADIDHTDTAPLFALPPTFTVRSGHGFHLWWKLDEPVTPTRAEGVMKFVQKSIGADPLWDAPRIMRVPGTQNWKTTPPVECTIIDHTQQAVYSLDDLQAAAKFNRKLLPAVYSEDAENFDSRSERDWAIVNDLKRSGVSDAGIHTLFEIAPCGEKSREDGPHYLEQTIAKASKLRTAKGAGVADEDDDSTPRKSKRRAAVDDDDDADESDESGFYEVKQETFFRSEKTRYRIATFRIEPLALIESDHAGTNDSLAATLHTPDKSWPITFPKKAFANVSNINNAMPQASAMWLGTDRQIREYFAFLIEKLRASGMQHMRATSTLGRHTTEQGPVWIGTEQTLTTAAGDAGILTENARKMYYLKNGRESVLTQYSFPNKGELAPLLKQVFPLITSINQSGVTLPVLGWFFASPFKPALLDAGVRFPHLNIFGTRGSGKSSFIKLMLRMMGVSDPRSFDAGTTPFVLLSLLGSTNAVPLSLTEFRLDNSQRLARMLLISYDSGRDARGNADQTTTEYPMTAPLVIDGEDGIADPATKERTIMVRLTPETIAVGTAEHKAFGAVNALPVEMIAGHYVKQSLDTSPQAAKAEFDKSLKAVVSDLAERGMPDRIANNVAVVNFGLSRLQCWLHSYGVKLPLERPAFIYKHIIDNVVEASGRTTLLVDEFVEAIINQVALSTQRVPFLCGYNPDTNELSLNVASCYAWWAGERRKQNRPLLGVQAIRTQLDERQNEYVVYNGTDELAVDVGDANKYGLDVPAKLNREKTFLLDLEN